MWKTFLDIVARLLSPSSPAPSESASSSAPSPVTSPEPSSPSPSPASSVETPTSEPEKKSRALQTSQAGIDLIKAHEGLRLEWYLCPANKPTIGYGHVILTNEQFLKAGPISEAAAEAILEDDLQKFERSVSKLVKVDLEQHEFDALVSFTFNVGAAALSRSTLLRLLNEGDREGAAAQFSRWVYANKKELPGLVKRRADEAELFRNGRAVAEDRS